jgi:hypothetical protein
MTSVFEWGISHQESLSLTASCTGAGIGSDAYGANAYGTDAYGANAYEGQQQQEEFAWFVVFGCWANADQT